LSKPEKGKSMEKLTLLLLLTLREKKLPLKNKYSRPVPWDYQIGSDNYQIAPFILKEGK